MNNDGEFVMEPYGLAEGTVAMVGLAAFLGHLFPVFFRFVGGKGVAAGMLAIQFVKDGPAFGAAPVDWLTDFPLLSVIIMVSWQWLPFATLIFITSLQSMNREQLEASRMDGANYLQQLRYLYLPHMARSVAVVVMIEMIFLLSVFAEIYTTTGGGPGDASTNVAFLIFKQALLNFDAGVASAGALFAVVLANIAAVFMIRMVGKNLDK